MKDVLNLIAELAKLELVQLIIVCAVGLVGWRIWVKANHDRQAPADGNRPATLLDMALFRQEIQTSNSGRSSEVFERIDDHESRISTLEGERPAPRYRHNPRK